jgi:hypothetical protein
VASELDPALPDCLPIQKWGLFSDGPKPGKGAPDRADLESLPLPALLARVLLGFALEYERESAVSLAVSANAVRVIEDEGTRVRDLPALSGVSKEALAMTFSFLTKRGYVIVEAEAPGSRMKKVRLTARGILAKDAYEKLAGTVEQRWVEKFGKSAVEGLRKCLGSLAADGTAERSPLFAGLEPCRECWRSKVSRPLTLPHYPMILHRGGYPDGS